MTANYFDKTNPAIRRAHKRFARPFTVSNFEWDDTAGSNAYADGDWIETTTTVQATVRVPSMESYDTDARGIDADVAGHVFVDPTEVDVTDGEDENTRATEFVDSTAGDRYKVINYRDEGGLLRCVCEEVSS